MPDMQLSLNMHKLDMKNYKKKKNLNTFFGQFSKRLSKSESN